MQAAFVAVFVIIAALSLAVGRWHMLLVPLIAWPAFYGAIGAGLIGSGLGDNWILPAALTTAASFAVTALLVSLRVRLRPPRRSSLRR